MVKHSTSRRSSRQVSVVFWALYKVFFQNTYIISFYSNIRIITIKYSIFFYKIGIFIFILAFYVSLTPRVIFYSLYLIILRESVGIF